MRAPSLVPVAWPWPTGAVADDRPQLTKVALPRSEGGARAPSYLLAPGPDGVALRVGPSRLGGSSAKVRWALDAAGRPVAVHCSRRPPTSFGPTSRERLEGAAYVSLHPDVVPRDAFVDRKGRRVLVMPLWETDLFALEATLCKSDDVRRAVGRKLLRDLAENYVRLHARGIVHNDCKPENVLVRRDGTFALTDVDCAFVERRTAPKSW